MERDPVCGMVLRPGQEEANANYQGKTYHFCSAECKNQFLKNPGQYLQSPGRAEGDRTSRS